MGSGLYTAAASQAIFDSSGGSWCGPACGICFNLTSTGKPPCSTCGSPGPVGKRITVLITNLCPHKGNEQWCPTVGGVNQYNRSYHFDLYTQAPLLGNNNVVKFEPVRCPGKVTSNYNQCRCSGGSVTGSSQTSRRWLRWTNSLSRRSMA